MYSIPRVAATYKRRAHHHDQFPSGLIGRNVAHFHSPTGTRASSRSLPCPSNSHPHASAQGRMSAHPEICPSAATRQFLAEATSRTSSCDWSIFSRQHLRSSRCMAAIWANALLRPTRGTCTGSLGIGGGPKFEKTSAIRTALAKPQLHCWSAVRMEHIRALYTQPPSKSACRRLEILPVSAAPTTSMPPTKPLCRRLERDRCKSRVCPKSREADAQAMPGNRPQSVNQQPSRPVVPLSQERPERLDRHVSRFSMCREQNTGTPFHLATR